MRCEQVFKQICWLQERFWPDVDGMGEEDDSGRYEGPTFPGANGLGSDGSPMGANTNGSSMSNGPFGGSLNGMGNAAGGANN
jgi:hypothetical protein